MSSSFEVSVPTEGSPGFVESSFDQAGQENAAMLGQTASGDNGEAGEDSKARMAQMMAIGQGALAYAKTMNPLQGMSNVSEARMAMIKETKNLFNPAGFSKPADRAEVLSRWKANASQFKLSYSACYALTATYFVLTSPMLLIEVGVVAGLWLVFYKVYKPEDVVTVGQYKIGKSEKMMILAPLSLFVAFFGGLLSLFIYIIVFATGIVGLHAAFRRPIEVDPLEELESAGTVPPQFV